MSTAQQATERLTLYSISGTQRMIYAEGLEDKLIKTQTMGERMINKATNTSKKITTVNC